jgi:hypothetical protein
MSVCTFIAADVALDEVKNPHEKLLSINEALAMGLEVDESILRSDIDQDEPDVIPWSDTTLVIENGKLLDGDCADDFALLTMDDPRYFCGKPYAVYLDWVYYTEGRAQKIIEYIRDVLEKTDHVELWNVWLSDCDLPPKVKTATIRIEALQPLDIKQIYEYDPWENASIRNTFGPDTPLHHCLRVVR